MAENIFAMADRLDDARNAKLAFEQMRAAVATIQAAKSRIAEIRDRWQQKQNGAADDVAKLNAEFAAVQAAIKKVAE